MSEKDKNRAYPIPYDYWVDREEGMVYAVIEYNNKFIDLKHSNLYLVSSEYKGN